jgi:hypothetical protein
MTVLTVLPNYLAPLAGRGRKLRAEQLPGEGEFLGRATGLCGRRMPLTPTLSPQAGRGSTKRTAP